ncbi:MAG: hypothetical protein EBT03_05775 [Betaproteobacteria bacterium]|nr:hypothetical protein [Betaproteobacteria bacterium]NBT74850.1 hypothetical protein [Betaproteobacteria bacterium]NBY13592.1 hypothetical protein [Betaproteobacteria bacterium]NCA16864.1 hypothetical protein [Betaproteobacteria bacterium]
MSGHSDLGDALDGLLSGIDSLLSAKGAASAGEAVRLRESREGSAERARTPFDWLTQETSVVSLMTLLASTLHTPGCLSDVRQTSLSWLRQLVLSRAHPIPESLRSRGDPRVSPRVRHLLARVEGVSGAHAWASADGQRLFYAEPNQSRAQTPDERWLVERSRLAPVGALARLEPGHAGYRVLSLPCFPEFCFCEAPTGEGPLRTTPSALDEGEAALVVWLDSEWAHAPNLLGAAWMLRRREPTPIPLVRAS